MSEHHALLKWHRTSEDFSYETYNREHEWAFPNGQSLRASSAPAYLGSEACVDPEEAFAASVAACHMLTFLAIAARKRYTVDSYTDEATAILDKNGQGAMAITRVELRPVIVFSGDRVPADEEIDAMHEKAHQHCFIANSVKCEVIVINLGGGD